MPFESRNHVRGSLKTPNHRLPIRAATHEIATVRGECEGVDRLVVGECPFLGYAPIVCVPKNNGGISGRTSNQLAIRGNDESQYTARAIMTSEKVYISYQIISANQPSKATFKELTCFAN